MSRMNKFTLYECAVMEAAARGLKAARGPRKKFNAEVFKAVAEYQLQKLRQEIENPELLK
jgi:hypothetical protein